MTGMKIYSVFHISLQELADDGFYLIQVLSVKLLDVVEGEGKYDIEEILNFSIRWMRLEYLVM